MRVQHNILANAIIIRKHNGKTTEISLKDGKSTEMESAHK
jgi:hypothetical protein